MPEGQSSNQHYVEMCSALKSMAPSDFAFAFSHIDPTASIEPSSMLEASTAERERACFLLDLHV